MKRSRLGPRDAPAAGRLGGGDRLGRRAPKRARGGGGGGGAGTPRRTRGMKPPTLRGPGGSAAVSCARAVRVPALPRSRARGLGPRGLRARPYAKARVTSSRPTRQAWDLQGRVGDFWGEGTLRPEGRDRGASCPRPRPGTVGDAGPRRAEPAFCFGSLRVCSLTLDSQLSLPGLSVLIIEMGRLDSLSS